MFYFCLFVLVIISALSRSVTPCFTFIFPQTCPSSDSISRPSDANIRSAFRSSNSSKVLSKIHAGTPEDTPRAFYRICQSHSAFHPAVLNLCNTKILSKRIVDFIFSYNALFYFLYSDLELAKEFSPNYIRIVQGMLSIAFDRAVALGIAKTNLSRMIGHIKNKKTEVDFWVLKEFQKVISPLYKGYYYKHYLFISFWRCL